MFRPVNAWLILSEESLTVDQTHQICRLVPTLAPDMAFLRATPAICNHTPVSAFFRQQRLSIQIDTNLRWAAAQEPVAYASL